MLKKGRLKMIEKVFKQLSGMLIFLVFLFLSGSVAYAASAFEENFEQGIGNWSADNGLWEVGTPEAPDPTGWPPGCHSGDQCAGTVLNGRYNPHADSRFISPSIRLPDISGDDEIHLRFYQWFAYSSNSNGVDGGQIEVSEYDEVGKKWSEFEQIGTQINYSSLAWSQKRVEITKYASKKIRFAFHHIVSDTYTGVDEGPGWYIDDIKIEGVEYGILPNINDSDGDGVQDSWDECAGTLPGACVDSVGCASENVYTQDQMDQAISNILKWGDADGDGVIGLEEAIHALQVTAGF
jgi:hypothetical protein